MRVLQLLLFGLFFLQVAAQTCSSSSRCKEGCCNRFGNCGFGPDFCGDDCISDCGRKSECNPGFPSSKWSEREKCPLNVCCSKHGYCGTTKDFCGDKKVKHKTCSKSFGNKIVAGYFEGWARDRPCGVFTPEDIPMNIYTHINFAFATIDPKTFKIMPAAQSDINLYRRLTLLKKKDPALQVYIAVGGWTFNDEGPTATTFSDIAASVPRQKAFIESLISFMSTYGFDGVDLDWEYPVAEDRSGREVDFANFPKFMARLKSSLDSANKGISITIPASYWYLQHFDLKALAKSVDFFNVMSYDLHGTWDQHNKHLGAFLNGHTNLTEIDLALDLLWRNDIDPDQVVLGMAFYGRAFTVSSSSCTEPGCTFESGGEPGKCSREVGILLNSEIDDLVKKHNVKPKLYKEEAVKVASWGDQWVQYDDKETFLMKSEYAQSRCLGGIMVWAISHDTKDAKYNMAFAEAANRQILQLPVHLPGQGGDEAFISTDIPNEQCKWTNCGQGCPSGWTHMKREDGAARKGEYMHDQTGCQGEDSHNFCCPSNLKLPTCGWYNHRNGKCNSECPEGMETVGGNSMYCNNGKWQAACCTKAVTSMKLYSKCTLGKEPDCDEQKGCPPSGYASFNELIAASGSGMGGMKCRKQSDDVWWGDKTEGGKNKYCCNTSDEKERWSKCEWSDCSASCPSGKVRVALDTTECKKGGKARCCTPSYFDTVNIENAKLGEYRKEIKKYLKDSTCSNPGSLVTQRLVKREAQGLPGQIKTMEICYDLLALTASKSMIRELRQIWDGSIGAKWPYLKSSYLEDITELYEYEAQGPEQVCHDLICSPNTWNSRLSGSSVESDCTEGFCKTAVGEDYDPYCNNPDGLSDDSMSVLHAHARNSSQVKVTEDDSSRVKLLAAAREYSSSLRSPDGSESVTVWTYLPPYNRPDANSPVWDEAVDFESFDDCGNLRLRHVSIPEDTEDGNGRFYDIEHVFDGNLIGRFLTDAAAGTLPSGAQARTQHVAISFFRQARTTPFAPTEAPVIPGGHSPLKLFERLMECLGSSDNSAGLMLVLKEINAAKTNLMQLGNPIDPNTWEKKARSFDRVDYYLGKLKSSIVLVAYLNRSSTPDVNGKLATILQNIDEQLGWAQGVWNQQNPTRRVYIRQYWREWVADFFGKALPEKVEWFVNGFIAELRKQWGVRSGEKANEVLEKLRVMEGAVQDLSIDQSRFF